MKCEHGCDIVIKLELGDLGTGIEEKLGKILAALARIEAWGKTMARTFADVQALVVAVDQHTNELAVIVAGLRDRLNGRPSPADIEAVASALNGVAQHLVSIGKDPSDPLPPPPTSGETGTPPDA